MDRFIIAPSLLAADFSKLQLEIESVTDAGAEWIHIDVMDGHFVPNITLGPPVLKCLRPVTTVPLDVHLMIEKPERFIKDFAQAGADYITIHVESTVDPKQVIADIRALGVKPGITLRPGTPVEDIETLIPLVDLVLVMTVEPGFGGQKFMQDQVQKISKIREVIKKNNSNALIEVDGGITDETAKYCKEADVLVAGSFIFKGESVADYQNSIRLLKGAKNA